ncbi:glutamine amidotransferase family protein [Aquisalimonas sp. 2447]|uniref:class II glutamine amidotransferase n=1 Tax=Aquisalimonas sp. 2447 TaxID=2740807 RepID=UPI0014324924|nr:glutamine amidotransferase family protein [Aquisalimonas sp. 2447]QIT54072.1 glutamine amidotransferase family protein [Aquisalimonas sp. 2447]
MCGIVGLYLKNEALQPRLGELFQPMLLAMGDRGPDSAGFAIYGDDVGQDRLKYTLQAEDPATDWQALADGLEADLGATVEWFRNATAAVFKTAADSGQVRAWLRERASGVRLMSVGHSIEILKGVGHPRLVAERFGLARMQGTHIIGHTRMATESAVTMEGSHPFSTGHDLCLVHNGSLSNHNRLRLQLEREGLEFDTDNDTEVAAAYLTWRLAEGDSLTGALERSVGDLDGFYTFTVGTRDGFAVLRDPIACKPAVLAETDDYVAMASEYRALAGLPGISTARVWEPEPTRVYVWEGSPQRSQETGT